MPGTRFLFCIILIVVLSSCASAGTENPTVNPTPSDFLDNEGADIFQLEGIVYSNASDVEWVQELDYEVGEQIGEISRQSDNAIFFNDGTANRLPVGTRIYDTDTPVAIAIIQGRSVPYLKMIEG
ncbi:hypothetical protein EQV77_06710 [Halobacillus fulvus]|nr:hypothetical protein EQV77_06710 [Halobacillus fulvus]